MAIPETHGQHQQRDDDTSSIASSGVLVVEGPMASSICSTGSSFVVVGEAATAPETDGNKPLTIPLDSSTPVKRVTVDGVIGDTGGRGVIQRRDSLKRRESLLKGKEGSRRRQRWENDNFLNHPHYVPPEPQDYLPQPVYPKRIVRYEFAALWDPTDPNMLGYTSPTSTKKQPQVPKNLRDRLKRSEWAVGLLRELEGEVRLYAAGIFGCSGGSSSRCSSVSSTSGEKKSGNNKRGGKRKLHNRPRSESVSSIGSSVDGGVNVKATTLTITGKDGVEVEQLAAAAVAEGLIEREVVDEHSEKDSEDEEIVFVPKIQRVLSMKDDDSIPTTENTPAAEESEAESVVSVDTKVELEKPVFEAPTGDPSASFIRWMIHSIATYYGLRSWSVDVGKNPCMRVAFVGINPSTPSTSKKKVRAKVSGGQHLPRELWRML